jgi:hypothetical protein
MVKKGSVVTPSRGEMASWAEKAIEHAGMSQADLSRVLVQAGLTSVDRAAVSKVIKGERVLKAEEMLEVSRITGYPIPDRRIGAPKPAKEPAQKPAVADKRELVEPIAAPVAPAPVVRSADHDDKEVNAQRAMRLRILTSTILEAQGMPAAVAEKLVEAIARAADMHQGLQDVAINPDQVRAEGRLLVALFGQKHPL